MIGLAISTVSGANAQDISESHMSAARAAIQAIQATDRFDDILPNVAEAIKQQLIANNPDLEPQINQAVDTETIKLVSRRADLETEAASAYAKALSEADLNAITAFYNSDAGKALLANGPIAAREVQGAAGVWQRGIERDLLANVSKQLAETAPRSAPTTPEATTEAPAAQ